MIVSKESFCLPDSEQWLFQSRQGIKRKLFIYKPTSAIPKDGFPIIYLLDANANFASYVENIRLQCRRAKVTGNYPPVVIGIGYETTEPYSNDRYYDFTFDSFKENLPKHPRGEEWPPHGGAETFLHTIEEEIKPLIEASIPINKKKQMLIGHSLGGLFTLFTLFTKPTAFQYYIASSPSIHWNETKLYEKLHPFTGKLDQTNLIKLLITIGEKEQGHFSNMYEKAKIMANKLSDHQSASFQVSFHEFLDDDHLTVLLPLINKSFSFINDTL